VTEVITIVLADHHHLIRQGVRLLLETEKDFEVVAEVADGLKVVGIIERRKPRVLIVASAMPGLNSFEVTLRVRQRAPETAIIVLSRPGRRGGARSSSPEAPASSRSSTTSSTSRESSVASSLSRPVRWTS